MLNRGVGYLSSDLHIILVCATQLPVLLCTAGVEPSQQPSHVLHPVAQGWACEWDCCVLFTCTFYFSIPYCLPQLEWRGPPQAKMRV